MSEQIMYVLFEKDSGKILGISPRKKGKNYLQVELDRVLGILEGTDSRKNYRVEYNPRKKELELINLNNESFDGSTIKDFLYEIPEEYIEDSDITVEQDIYNSCWRFILGKTLKTNLSHKGVSLNSNLNFAITKKHDPHVLYKTISVDFASVFSENCVVIPFDSDFEFSNLPFSIFTARKFDSYQLKRIYNDE